MIDQPRGSFPDSLSTEKNDEKVTSKNVTNNDLSSDSSAGNLRAFFETHVASTDEIVAILIRGK